MRLILSLLSQVPRVFRLVQPYFVPLTRLYDPPHCPHFRRPENRVDRPPGPFSAYPLGTIRGNGPACCLLAFLDCVPQVLRHDAQFRDFLNDPRRLGIRASLAFTCCGVLHKVLAVPDQATAIEVVVQDPRSAPPVAVDGRLPPIPAERPWDVFGIQTLGNCRGGQAIGEVPEYRSDNLGFFLVDGSLAPYGITGGIRFPDDAVAITEAAAGTACPDTALHSAMGFQGKILEEESVHGALEADMQFFDFTFRQSDQADIGEAQVLEQARHVFLIS